MPDPSATNRPHPPRARAAGAVLCGWISALAALLTSACATAPPKPSAPAAPIQTPSLQPVSGSISGSAASIDFRPFGAIPTDGITLPVLSPNGRYMAVQTGAAPDLATALARPGQRPPLASRIALYRIDPRGLVRLGETDGGLVLGRNADDRGVLVERPQTDGTRWIGRLDWNNLEPEWLVQDGNVNAFAALGAEGTLVYSTRPVTSALFNLTVKKGDSVRSLDGDGTRSYLFPALSADASTVFTLVLRDGILELGSADPTSGESLKQSLARAFVTDRGSDELALFMSTAQGVREGIEGKDWILYHRSVNSLARWNSSDGLRVIPGNAMARARVDATREAVLAGGKVRLRAAEGAVEPGTVVSEQLGVPRALGAVEDRPAFVIFTPEQSGVRMVIVRIVNETTSPVRK
ncbi:MAG: hypothetical protein RLZZ116_22 [Planctomycetota bacterium]|jgi:hypothetical protein